MGSSKTSEAKAKVSLDSAHFEKGAKAVMNAANAMSSAVTTAFAAAGAAVLVAFGAKSVGAIVASVKSVLDLGESMANAGKMAGIAAGQFYLFSNAVEKGLTLKTTAGLIGENAQVLNRSAAIFRDVSIKLWAVGEKIRGFWLGLVERLAPVLSRLLDGALTASLVEAGQAFGGKIADAISVIYQLAKDGKLWSTFTAGFKLAFDYAGERMVWLGNIGYQILKLTLENAFKGGIEDALGALWGSILSFGEAFGEAIGSAFFTFWTEVLDVVYGLLAKLDSFLNSIGALSDSEVAERAKAQKDAQANIASRRAVSNSDFSTSAPKEASLTEKISDIFKNNQFSQSSGLSEGIAAFTETISTALSDYKADAFGADSLSSIGGGGGVYLGLSVLDVQKSQLTVLRSIDQKLNGGSPTGTTQGDAPSPSSSPTVSRWQVNPDF